MKSELIRKKYISFFKDKKKHKVIASAPLVPENDPTLLFTSAGMNQFKEEFRGNVTDFRRAVTCQKCLRTGDLDRVGTTPAHHTFFEMLGNFSFGDYFKREAITWAWEFLTKELKIAKEYLWVSVYLKDDEAFNIWVREIGVPIEKIVKLGEEENFWPSDAINKGPNGPCGPCSEIFYDQGASIGCGKDNCSVACSCGRFVEIWNLVFTQFERKEGSVLEPLPNKNIDTGMGLERMAAVMQEVGTNFEIDILRPIVDFICKQTGINYGNDLEKRKDVYCITDHMRAVTFAICENILPSNEERGYVIRKLIRKSAMHARNLGQQEPFLYKIVSVVAKVMHGQYPELKKRQKNISNIVEAEEKRFSEVLKNAKDLVHDKFFGKENIDTGKVAFELYDTFGLPLEVTKEFARNDFNIEINEQSFNEHMSHQKELSKAGSNMQGEVFAQGIAKALSGVKKTEFLGYQMLEAKAKVVLIAEGEERKEKAFRDQKLSIILDKTPFYAEKGGQAADKGKISNEDFIFDVKSTEIYNDIIIHTGQVVKGEVKIGEEVRVQIDEKRRLAVAKHHTATHLLQAALRKVLGQHVEQAGSFVDESRLRFDFTHFKALDKKELEEVEKLVNGYIKKNIKVEAKVLSKDEALKLGAIALFGEKYGDKVRVIIIDKISKELCGGTHLSSTGQASLFKITRESAISAGVRRIEAVCSEAALSLVKEEEKEAESIAAFLKTDIKSVPNKIKELDDKLKGIKKEITGSRDRNISAGIDAITAKAKKEFGTDVIIKRFEGISSSSLRSLSDNIANKLKSYIVILASAADEKINLIVSVSRDNIDKNLNANLLVKDIVKELGGSGGGRADFAQAGAKDSGKLDEIIKKIPEIIRGQLK